MSNLQMHLDDDKVTKASVNYRPAATDKKCCGTCSMFDGDKHSCTLVKGHILANRVCNRWEAIKNNRKDIVSAETDKHPVGEKKSVASISMQAMSLNIPTDPHPNKMPFSGILTRIGVPSDSAPVGSGDKNVMITAEAATKALDSLLGMAVDYQPDFDGHDPKAKIGVITAADIDGDAIVVKGFIYAADFPEVAAQIKANKHNLGMSFEARELWTNDKDADVVPIIDCVFTGAAILLKDKAAYKTTSIAASKAAKQEDIIMTDELKAQLAEIVSAAVKPVADALAAQGEQIKKLETEKIEAANQLSKVEKHANEMEKAAEHMDAAGIGGHPTRGHVALLRNMASDLRAQAAVGKMPHSYDYFVASAEKKEEAKVDVSAEVAKAVEAAKASFATEVKAAAEKSEATVKDLTDKLASAETKFSDLQAKAQKEKGEGTAETQAPAKRKTLTNMTTQLLAKAAIEMPKEEGAKLSLDALNAATKNLGLSVEQRFQLKTELHNAGLID